MPPLPSPLPDAEFQCRQLADLIRPHLHRRPALIGIFSGGAWIAERLKALLDLPENIGLIDVSFYRDDFAAKYTPDLAEADEFQRQVIAARQWPPEY